MTEFEQPHEVDELNFTSGPGLEEDVRPDFQVRRGTVGDDGACGVAQDQTG